MSNIWLSRQIGVKQEFQDDWLDGWTEDKQLDSKVLKTRKLL